MMGQPWALSGRGGFRELPQFASDARQWHVGMSPMTEVLPRENDRRESLRFSVNAPVTVVIGGREMPAYTRDLSNRGVYFYLALADNDQIDKEFEFTVDLPPEITLSTCCRIRCHGKLLRQESTSTNLTGVAAEIISYSIQREFVSIA
jgi:hypothetical protein